MAGSAAPAGELVVAGSTRSSDGSGVGKNSLGEMDALTVQSLPDSADRITITTLKYANVPT